MHKNKSPKNRPLKKLFKNISSKKSNLNSPLSNHFTLIKYNKICAKLTQSYNIFVYITTKDDEEALLIASSLINLKLIACANILPAITAVFYWENAVQKAQETALIVKTTKDKLSQICKAVTELHSYTCPCIVALPIIAGNNDFLQWIHNSIHPSIY